MTILFEFHKKFKITSFSPWKWQKTGRLLKYQQATPLELAGMPLWLGLSLKSKRNRLWVNNYGRNLFELEAFFNKTTFQLRNWSIHVRQIVPRHVSLYFFVPQREVWRWPINFKIPKTAYEIKIKKLQIQIQFEIANAYVLFWYFM